MATSKSIARSLVEYSENVVSLTAWCFEFDHGQMRKEVLLVYPASDTFTKPLKPFWYRAHDEVLYVVPYDFNSENLILPSQSLVNEDMQIVAQSV